MTRIDPARLGATYAALMAAHDVGDHIVQTDHQAATKASSWAGMVGHVGSYTALQVAALVALRAGGVRPSWRRTLVAVAWSAGTHAILDRRRPVAALLRMTGSPGFALSNVQPERELLVCANADADPDGPTNIEEAGHALAGAIDAVRRGDNWHAGDALSFAIRHAVAVIDPERPLPIHGPYLADQALHHACLLVAAAILAGGRTRTAAARA